MAKKSKKARECPALGRVLSPTECGNGRGTSIDCPADCRYYPWGFEKESTLIELAAEWVGRAVKRLVDRLGTQHFKQRLEEQRLPLQPPDLATEYAILTGVQMELFHRQDAEGRTEAEHWAAEGWAGLNNDLRCVMRYREKARPRLLEVREVLDDRRGRCVDLLDSEATPITLFGRTRGGPPGRYGGILTWVVPYPHYHRTISIAMRLAPTLVTRLRGAILQEYASVRSEQPEMTFDDFMVSEFGRFCRWALEADQEEHSEVEAGVIAYRAQYALKVPVEEAEQLLVAAEDFSHAPDLEADSETERVFDWNPIASGETPGVPVVDTTPQPDSHEEALRVVVLDTGECWIACDWPDERAALRTRLEALLGDRISFQREEDLDWGATRRLSAQQRHVIGVADPLVFSRAAAAPPRTGNPAAQEPPIPASASGEKFADLLSRPRSWLEGKTIEEAAQHATLRPEIIQFLKCYIYGLDACGLSLGSQEEWAEVLEKLGLHELK